MRSKLTDLLTTVNQEIHKAQAIAQRSKEDANALSHGAVASPSSSGDREHAQNQATINAANLQKLIDFKTQLEDHIHNQSHTAEAVSFIEIEFEDGSRNTFYLVESPIYLSTFKFISTNSPLGQAILGKTIGERFAYGIAGQKFSGKIVNLE